MPNHFREISTGDLLNLIKNKTVQLIDVRPADAYNGWCLRQESRGGHIPGARSLPAKWTRYIDWIEFVRNKRILPDKPVIIYGYDPNDAEMVAESFLKAGYQDIVCYSRFLQEWVTCDDLPIESLSRFRNLVPASWVNQLITGQTEGQYENDHFVLIHVHYRNREAYLSGHIPGAIDMDTLAVEAPGTWNRRRPAELKETFEKHGISSGTTAVVYGKYMDPDTRDPFPGSAAGDIGAMRVALILMYAGVKDVRVVNGGFQSWIDAGFDVSTVDVPKKPVSEFGAPIPVHPELITDIEEAKRILASPDAELVCVRSLREYHGEVSGYHYIVPKGRIPGAVFTDCGSDAYHMENYRNPDQTCREYPEIAQRWTASGITPGKKLAFYCGTGWRGSEAWFNAWLMGWSDISVFDGGWLEWCSDPANPVETGIPENSKSHE